MVQRWVFSDPSVPETYTVELNPNAMTSIWREKNITYAATTAVDGQTLMTEGNPNPKQWEFSGVLISKEHYDALLKWSKKRVRTYITDHYGRRLTVYWTNFSPVPQRSVKYPWRHNYTCTAVILGVLAADGTTVLEGTP
jgi:hypothetical protein